MLTLLAPYGAVNVAVNGLEAMAAIEKAWQVNEPYDLICLDIMLPEMDGFQVLKNVRRMEKQRTGDQLNHVKIIMTSALNDPRIIERAYGERCEAYLVKSISKAQLIDTIRTMGLLDKSSTV